MNTQDEIKELKKRIAELEEQSKQEQDFPEYCDDYWFLSGGGTIDDSFYTDSRVDNKRLGMGNMFRTRQQAQFALEKLKVEAELRKFSDSWDLEKTQYTFSFNWEVGEFEIDYPDYNQYPGSYYFDSLDSWEQAIESVGEERIKKYIFEVEEQ